MAPHYSEPTHYHRAIGAHEPVLYIAGGDTVITTTVDAMGQDARGERVTESGNPQTGPFYVEGAEPGDTLVVHLDRIEPNRETGITAAVLAPNGGEPGFAPEPTQAGA